MPNPTIYDVARAAGVGIGTVSRVLNASARVSPETQEKVQAAIGELGYRRSKVARQLSTGIGRHNVGAIMPFITHPSFVERLRGIQLALNAQDNDFNLILYNISEPDQYPEQLQSIVEHATVDGLLIATLTVTDEQRELLNQAGIPFVTLSDASTGELNCISPDNLRGGYLATEHLLELGHRRIATIHGDPWDTAGAERLGGYSGEGESYGRDRPGRDEGGSYWIGTGGRSPFGQGGAHHAEDVGHPARGGSDRSGTQSPDARQRQE